MAIGAATERKGHVYAYDEFGEEIWFKKGNLHGYTCEYVAIIENNHINLYDENENKKNTKGIPCEKELHED